MLANMSPEQRGEFHRKLAQARLLQQQQQQQQQQQVMQQQMMATARAAGGGIPPQPHVRGTFVTSAMPPQAFSYTPHQPVPGPGGIMMPQQRPQQQQLRYSSGSNQPFFVPTQGMTPSFQVSPSGAPAMSHHAGSFSGAHNNKKKKGKRRADDDYAGGSDEGDFIDDSRDGEYSGGRRGANRRRSGRRSNSNAPLTAGAGPAAAAGGIMAAAGDDDEEDDVSDQEEGHRRKSKVCFDRMHTRYLCLRFTHCYTHGALLSMLSWLWCRARATRSSRRTRTTAARRRGSLCAAPARSARPTLTTRRTTISPTAARPSRRPLPLPQLLPAVAWPVRRLLWACRVRLCRFERQVRENLRQC